MIVNVTIATKYDNIAPGSVGAIVIYYMGREETKSVEYDESDYADAGFANGVLEIVARDVTNRARDHDSADVHFFWENGEMETMTVRGVEE